MFPSLIITTSSARLIKNLEIPVVCDKNENSVKRTTLLASNYVVIVRAIGTKRLPRHNCTRHQIYNKMRCKMNRIIIIEDYLWEGNYIIGYPYEENKEKEGNYILEDGDVYTISQLKEDGYSVAVVEPKEIIKKFKGKFKRRMK